MPLAWEIEPKEAPADAGASSFAGGAAPLARLRLWPHRSLPRRGFVVFIGATFALIILPLFPLLGTAAFWGLLPFPIGAVWLIWHFLMRSYEGGETTEVLTLWPDRLQLHRAEPRRDPREWSANPHWVSVHLHQRGGPVSDYVTLRGAGREVEIGAFLSAGERRALYGDLTGLLARLAR